LGFALAVPVGFAANLRPRSGHAYKKGITVLNTPGTIDAGYRDEVGCLIINLGQEDFVIQRGDRIAQMVIEEIFNVTLRETQDLDDTSRGMGGFGSTGVSL
jgi:dUTP pyrophosphatase